MRLSLPLCSAILLIAVASPGTAQETGEILRGQILASTCFTCHGTDGISPGAIPSVSGIPAESLRRSLQEFRDGRRPSTVMGRHATGYSDEDIASIAAYLSRVSQEPRHDR